MARPKTPPEELPITKQQERFINEYMVCLNGAQAARAAGYSADTAKEQASRLLAAPHILAELERRFIERRLESKGRAQKVIDNLHQLADNATRDGDRIRANELLAKHYGLLNDRVEHTHYNGGDMPTITVEATPQQATEVYATLLN